MSESKKCMPYILSTSSVHLLMTVAMLVKRLSHKMLGGEKGEITPEQWVLLQILKEQDGIQISEIAGRSKKDMANVTRIISKLEKLGCVEKQKGTKDTRKSHVYITKRGNEVRESNEKKLWAIRNKALSNLTEEEQEQLNKLLLKMEKGIEKELNE